MHEHQEPLVHLLYPRHISPTLCIYWRHVTCSICGQYREVGCRYEGTIKGIIPHFSIKKKKKTLSIIWSMKRLNRYGRLFYIKFINCHRKVVSLALFTSLEILVWSRDDICLKLAYLVQRCAFRNCVDQSKTVRVRVYCYTALDPKHLQDYIDYRITYIWWASGSCILLETYMYLNISQRSTSRQLSCHQTDNLGCKRLDQSHSNET